MATTSTTRTLLNTTTTLLLPSSLKTSPIGLSRALISSNGGLNTRSNAVGFFRRSFSKVPTQGGSSTSEAVINSILNVLESMSQKKAKSKDSKESSDQVGGESASTTSTEASSGIYNHAVYDALKKFHKSPQLEDLKYWRIYPAEVRKWLFATRARQGYFDGEGRWVDFDARGLERLVAENEMMNSEPVDLPFKEQYTKVPPPKKLRTTLPYDLQGAYRFGVTEEEAKELPEKARAVLSFEYATQHEINVHRKKRLVERWGKTPYDTGAPEAVIACLSEKIKNLTQHLNNNRQDKVSLRTLTRYITERTQMMKYLKKKNAARYYEVLKEIGLKDVVKINMFPMRNADLVLDDISDYASTATKSIPSKSKNSKSKGKSK
eukprot:TRINITY_DN4947_c0_g1_i1.p1 TRINITY_DN4947_c0_g1~~TRINITY_DN4947_c0_g1_i1.p1  ORF type:complete len:387 (-),score=104.60 TRINITY_DN4947_c0_g1_i1:113-1246(-)